MEQEINIDAMFLHIFLGTTQLQMQRKYWQEIVVKISRPTWLQSKMAFSKNYKKMMVKLSLWMQRKINQIKKKWWQFCFSLNDDTQGQTNSIQ